MRLILFIIPFALCLFSCSSGKEPPNIVQSDMPDQQMDSTSIVFTVNGDRNATLFSTVLYKYVAKEMTIGKKIRIDFDGEPPEGDGVLFADSGVVFDSKNIIEIYGNIHFRTEKGSELYTQSLFWHTDNDKITTDDYVKIIRDGDVIEGKGLETDVGFNRVIIKENVTSELSNY